MAKETYTDETSFERLVVLAKEGQRNALEELVRRIQDRIYIQGGIAWISRKNGWHLAGFTAGFVRS